MINLIYYIAIILFGEQAFETPIGLLCSSRLSQFTYLVVLFVEVTFDHVSEWYVKQRYMKSQIDKERQDLLGVIGI